MVTAGGSPSLSRSAAKGVAPAFSGGVSPNTKISRTDVPRAASRALSRNSGTVIRYFAPVSRSWKPSSSGVYSGLAVVTMPPIMMGPWNASAYSGRFGL